jgi:hypothetical protein
LLVSSHWNPVVIDQTGGDKDYQISLLRIRQLAGKQPEMNKIKPDI